MSRFTLRDESSGDSESEKSDDDQVKGAAEGKTAFGGFDSSSSDEETRVVRSVKDKRFEAMLKIIAELKSNIKADAWVEINKNFEELKKALKNANSIVQKEGIPKFWIKATLAIDAAITDVTENKSKQPDFKLRSDQSKSFNTCKHKMKKHLKLYQEHIVAYLKNPLISEEEKSSDSDSDSDSGSDSDKKSGDSDGSGSDGSDSEDWDSELSSDDDEDDFEALASSSAGPQFTREYWMKKPGQASALSSTPVCRMKFQKGDDCKCTSERGPNKCKLFKIYHSDSKKQILGVWYTPEELRTHATSMLKAMGHTSSESSQMLKQGGDIRICECHFGDEDLEGGTLKMTARPDQLKKKRSQRPKKASESSSSKKKVEEEKNLTPEQVLRKLKDLLAMRGKRGTNRAQVMADLEMLATKAQDPVAVLRVQTALITSYLEINLNKGVHMDITIWKKSVTSLLEMMQYLGKNANLRLSEDEEIEEHFESDNEEDTAVAAVVVGTAEREARRQKAREAQEVEEKKNVGVTYIQGNFYSFLYRLHIELSKSLQNIDPHAVEYVERLRDEPTLADLAGKAALYYASIDKEMFQCQCVLIQLELSYYQTHIEYMADLKSVKACPQNPIVDLAVFLYQHGDARQKTRALLSHVYFLAVHNYFTQSRDLLLMSHIQDKINDTDVPTRILFNRAMAQLGLCAFRTGNYMQGLNCLADLHASQRIKELLGQGISRFHERDVQQEKLEKRRQYPFHMHINLDTLESVHLIGGMFAEVDNIAVSKRKIVSKLFRRFYEHHHRNVFNAPPENTRDLIMHATKSLSRGDWKACSTSILSLRMWQYIRNPEYAQDLITTGIKETALRMYLMVFGSSYVSISLPSLCSMFELTSAAVIRITSKMMVTADLEGVWDQPSQTLVMHASQPTRLQKAAQGYADKVALLVEENERLLDQRHGFYQKGDSKRWDRNPRKTNPKGGAYTRATEREVVRRG